MPVHCNTDSVRSVSYTHLDASGLRELSHDSYGRMVRDTSFGTVESSLQEDFDTFGRSTGYRLLPGTRTVQHSPLDYDRKGGMIGMNLDLSRIHISQIVKLGVRE